MSTRLQISDKNNNLLTVQIKLNILSPGGTWMPDYPGKVRSDPDWENNTWYGIPTSKEGAFLDAHCLTTFLGAKLPVMFINGLLARGTWSCSILKGGTGYLFAIGNLTMAEGFFTWTNLDAVLADSADDSSDSDSDGSDDSSDVSDSAYA